MSDQQSQSMPDPNELKKLRIKNALRRGIRKGAEWKLDEKKLDQATEQLLEIRKPLDRSDLEKVGSAVASDQKIFESADISDLKNLLDDAKK